jgi:hypothetical protein
MDSVVSIPKRVSSYCMSISKGLKPPSLASEVSIPERVSAKTGVFLPLPLESYDTG